MRQSEIVKQVKENGSCVTTLKSWASIKGLHKLGFMTVAIDQSKNLYLVLIK